MFVKIRIYMIPHRIQNKIYAFTTGEFCRRNEITITRYKDYLVDGFFVRKGSNIQSNSHIHALLSRIISDIMGGQI